MSGEILVLSEHVAGVIDNVTYELLTLGRQIADEKGIGLAVLVLGNQTNALQDALSESGADVVLVADDLSLETYSAEVYAAVISDVVRERQPMMVLTGYTYFGIEMSAAVATRSGGSILSNCQDLNFNGDKPVVVRPMYGGTLLSRIGINGPAPYVLSFEKGALPRVELSGKTAELVSVPVAIEPATLKSSTIEIIKAAVGEIDIKKANILVSAGRGIADKENLTLISELAEALGGAISCSRPVADMGWLTPEYQVGISANYVTPSVYIACGISGASQHVAAMRDSGLIIAINKDANAPIFRVAHYGIIGDLFDVIPAMIKEAQG
ncbi:electron transfer flavoprotein subunit alpha/FixB family protein [bacterium]|nr:electron transfer flavoprotein subunit alpha/FixB family protein [bacterium]